LEDVKPESLQLMHYAAQGWDNTEWKASSGM